MTLATLSRTDDLIERLAAIVGTKHVMTDEGDMGAYLTEPRDLYAGRARCVVRPGTTAEVAAILALCNETNTRIVPQGGNTGLVGGQIPGTSGDEIVLSLKRMDKVRELDTASNTMVVEAGMTLLRVQEEADKADRLFPLSLASEGSCTIGGNLATNAGGTAVLAYGNARDLVTGLEIVLADGRVLTNLSKLKKDNTGYDLKHLFMGSEGTLGIITAAVLKLFPKPRSTETAFIGLTDPDKALALFTMAQKVAGGDVKTFELMPRIGIEFVLRHGPGTREPLSEPHDWYVLLELASQSEEGLPERMMALLESAMEDGLIDDAAVAASLDQRKDFWKLRELLSDVQKLEGGSIKHDVSVPVAQVPQFLREVKAVLDVQMAGARPVPFGHLGDGNIHYNISQPIGGDKQAFLDRWSEANDIVHGIVAQHQGSISAEHGIGLMKRDLLPGVKDPVAMEVMRAIKKTLDPKGILNPGKVLA
ncbi:MAG: linked oxidase domain protein [Hyphomicrobiales bacterium]|nr:linked oxidase domain protein [Hyphomicrobiales bacterium]